MAQDTIEFKISQDLVRPILQEKIRLAIAESIGQAPKIIDDMIDFYLNQQCDSTGKISSYSSENKHKRVDVLLTNLIKESVSAGIKEYMDVNRQILAAAIQKYFASKKGSAAIINAISTGLVDSMVAGWRYNLTVSLPRS